MRGKRARWLVACAVLVAGAILAYILWPRSIEYRARQIVARLTAQDVGFVYDVLLEKDFDCGVTRANFDQPWRQIIAPTIGTKYSAERLVRIADVNVYPDSVTVTCVYRDDAGGQFESTWYMDRRGDQLRVRLFDLLSDCWIDQLGTKESNFFSYFSAHLAGLERDLSRLNSMGIRGFVVVEDNPIGQPISHVQSFSEYKKRIEAKLATLSPDS